ncbi:putative Gnk2-like domain-containing protein [Helianthus annuus]|nr:putative Gnk2-like domain-containing protein [Helianthus annuus]
MLRYANYSMVSVMNFATFIPECNKIYISDQTRFWHVATNFMGQLATHVLNDMEVKYAYDELPYNDGKIYGYVQCTPDLTDSDCGRCLRTNIDRLSKYCYGKEGARVLAASCDVRFEIYKFLQFSAASSQNQGFIINLILL